MIKPLNKVGTEINDLNTIKVICENASANTMFNVEKLCL
jgi:hypothetical protein